MNKTRQKAQRGTVKKVLRCLRPYRSPAAVSAVTAPGSIPSVAATICLTSSSMFISSPPCLRPEERRLFVPKDDRTP